MLCLASTLAVATEMICAKDDGKGQCIAATDPDGKTLVVVGEGLKAGEQMDCEDRGTHDRVPTAGPTLHTTGAL